MTSFEDVRISDPIHKSIQLSTLEARIIETPAFQRLRSVKHLGLAYLVFPGADFSRFAHSLGACHVMGRMLSALDRSGTDGGINRRDIQLYRLAALLHDIGHYPFSHAMEDAVKDYYTGQYIVDEIAATTNPLPDLDLVRPFGHERVGKEILTRDHEVRSVIEESGFRPDAVSSIFMREGPTAFANLISSDMDADRIDYLLRTAYHTGLPYGSVDLDYILSQIRIDSDGNICLSSKALRAADHFLLSRYFDYQQVAYHKTVVALELVLKDTLEALLKANLIQCSASWVSAAIESGNWHSFDDLAIINEMRKLRDQTTDEIVRHKVNAILDRRPPKLVWSREFLGQRLGDTRKHFKETRRFLNSYLGHVSDKFGIDPQLWFIWSKEGLALTKIGSHVSVAKGFDDDEQDRYEQTIRIIGTDTHNATPIVATPQSLMSVLSNYALYALRLYVLLPPGMEARRREINSYIKQEMGDND